MPPPWPRLVRTTAITGQPPASAAEFVAATLPVSDAGADQAIDLEGWIHLTTGTATTALTLRIRRGGIGGAVVLALPPTTIVGPVGSAAEYGIQAVDQPGDVASVAYVLTVVQVGATAAGVLNAAMLRATIE